MSRVFEARYGGTCANPDCGTGRIVPGQQVRFEDAEDDDLVHEVCPAGEFDAPATTCPRCFTVLPATGVCGVCE